MKIFRVLVLVIILSVISTIVTTSIILKFNEKSQEELINDFYLSENAVHVSPHHIRKALNKGEDDFILVDLRSQEEYEREHIVTAINIPAYKDPDTSAYSDVERIVNSFKELQEDNQDKDIIVYCYSGPCMTGRKVGLLLVENNIYVRHLGIGWNEWRYFWDLWNHEHEWDVTNVEDYVYSGQEPGNPILKKDSTVCPIEGGLGC
tara:strand:+ start:638 stop:1252 length:615 start_codon:yes stop_codon:yes gene_type:complete